MIDGMVRVEVDRDLREHFEGDQQPVPNAIALYVLRSERDAEDVAKGLGGLLTYCLAKGCYQIRSAARGGRTGRRLV